MNDADQEVAALRAARAEAVGRETPAGLAPGTLTVAQRRHVDWPALLAAGWTPLTYAWIRRLVEHARRTGAAVYPHGGGTTTAQARRWGAGLRLTEVAEWLAEDGVPIAVLAPWLTVIAGDPDAARTERLRIALWSWTDPDAWHESPAEWPERLGTVAALTWAAGLTLEEACARATVDTLTEDGLRMMAGLRGYRLPDFLPTEAGAVGGGGAR